MTYYRFGQRLKMTRAVARAMARSSAGKQNSATIEKLVQTSKNRFGSATTMTDTTELRVSENFPRVPKPCEKVATKFFACFYEHGKQPKGESDPEAGNVALDKCKDALLAYNTCVDTELAKNPKQLFRVPEAYRTRE
ncbi:Thiosulfate sulfurtransferase/rhodanese domain-containing protein 2 [Phytophthora nicotianae]|uniref:Thiosulfate sulfurtransferase/rhodanese domain-containing protein 2 n=1 Tax=Phytophthora nicotianae TaxID=4792 RepID=A0A0W8DHC0_PHYNI|nr:Thiosulfate sulfurtransferase/rhodanese domain-containing protein 2 [Phytophthora nicotianae]